MFHQGQGWARPRPSPFMRPFCLQGGGSSAFFRVWGGVSSAFFGREAPEKGVFGAEGAVLENFSNFSKKLLKKNAIKSDFRKKIGVKIFPKKWVSWNVQKTEKNLKIPPLWGENFQNFGPRGGVSSAFFRFQGVGFERLLKTDAGLAHPWFLPLLLWCAVLNIIF